MSMLKIKKGDTVKVIAGKDKDKEGKVTLLTRRQERLTVEAEIWWQRTPKPVLRNRKAESVVRKDQTIALT